MSEQDYKTYTVRVNFSGHAKVAVEAKNEDDAREQADGMVYELDGPDSTTISDWQVYITDVDSSGAEVEPGDKVFKLL